jgi:hypothetical protein
MSINKFSTAQEVKDHFPGVKGRYALAIHLNEYYPGTINETMSIFDLEKLLNTLSTKAMEAL